MKRNLQRWKAQYDLSKTTDVKSMERLYEWLSANVPEEKRTIVHGDYRYVDIVTSVHPLVSRLDNLVCTFLLLAHDIADTDADN